MDWNPVRFRTYQKGTRVSTPLNVLILEDRAEEAKLLVIELRRAGIEAQCSYAQDEPSYLAALSKPLDLILADYSLPSFDAMRALKLTQERGLKIPFIVVSGSVDEEVVVECMKQGAADYLLKDRLTRLGPAVRHAIEQHHLRIQHQRAEQALRASEERFRVIFQMAPIGTLLADLQGYIIDSNQIFQDMIGYTGDELRTMIFTQFTHPDDRKAGREIYDGLIAGNYDHYSVERRYIHKNGQTIWGRPSASLVRNADGTPQFSIVAIENIADQKQAGETRSRLAAIVDSSDAAILSRTLDGMVMSWNAGAERIYGYTAAEIINQPASILCPLDRVDEETRILESIGHGEGINHWEMVHVRKDRKLIDVSLTISPIRDTSGRLIGASTIARDISERKRAEKALKLQTAFVQLLQAVAVAANQATSLQQALQTAIDQICTRIGWPVGHVYLAPEAGPYALASTNIWHFADPDRFAIFQTITEAIPFVGIDDLPGQVLISGKPEWITDITAVPSITRAKLISDIGVRAGFAFPVLIGAEVAAVLEFFAAEAIEPDESLLEIMAHVGTQLGRVVERTRTETAMRDSEERYRLIAENTGDIITLMDLDGRQIYVSPACESLLGYRPLDLIGRLIFDLIHPDDRAMIQQQWASIQQESDARTTVRYQHADGSWRWFEVHGTALVQNGIGYILGVSRDVTQRKQAEEALRATEAKYRTLVEQIPAIIYTAEINEQSSTIYVSPQIEPILGFSPEEWMADPDLWVEQLHPDDRARVLDAVGRAQASDAPVPDEYRSITRDGRVVWLQDAARVVRDEAGKPLFMQGITLDITERKVAEEAVRSSERLYRLLASNFPNGAVILFDRDLRFTIADGKGLADIGLSSATVEGQTLWDIFPPDLTAQLERLYRAALAGTASATELPLGNRVYETYIHPVKNEQDEIFAGLIVAQDITERKGAEEALSQERALLARRVAERTADLSAANAELARAARLKDEFLASMSHELRTPLNAILGLSEALQEQVYGALNDRQSKTIYSIEESGRHLLELINDILDLAKIGAGKLELEIEPVAIDSICQASMRLIKQAAQKKRIAVETAIDPTIGHVNVDARRLKQILLNLLSNAVKFTLEGGAIGLEVTCDRGRQLVQLSVWDTGIGIAEDQLPSLFQPFVQLDSRLARHYEGTGLGLALVYRMVQMHGGSIAVTSEVGVGSRFTVALPWRALDTDAEPFSAWTTQQEPALARPSAIRRALIIEDSPTAINQMTRYLQEFGIVALASPHGADALAEAIETQPDMIILDLLLPDMAGWDVLAQLKAEPRTHAIPIVIVSVMDDRSKGAAYGAAAYLVKPFTRLDVQQVLRTLESGNVRSSNGSMPAQSAACPSTNAEPVVLLAEDNEANITTVSDYLAAHGYLVVVARNGAEAVARAREARPCIVLMDIQMPGMDGLEATRRIRADRTMPQMPIIALTALAMPGDRERCLEAGASDYLSKPISLKQLVAKLETYLQHSSTEPRTFQ